MFVSLFLLRGDDWKNCAVKVVHGSCPIRNKHLLPVWCVAARCECGEVSMCWKIFGIVNENIHFLHRFSWNVTRVHVVFVYCKQKLMKYSKVTGVLWVQKIPTVFLCSTFVPERAVVPALFTLKQVYAVRRIVAAWTQSKNMLLV